MSDSKKQSTTILGNNNNVQQDITINNTYSTTDPNAIDNTEKAILLRKVVEFERSLADFKQVLQPTQTSATKP